MPRGITVDGYNDLTTDREHVQRQVADQNRWWTGGGVPAEGPAPERIAPVAGGDLETSLTDAEKARGLRYMDEDGDTFKAQMLEAKRQHPGLSYTQIARSVLKHREQAESRSAEAMLVHRMNHMTRAERQALKDRAARGLPLLDDDK